MKKRQRKKNDIDSILSDYVSPGVVHLRISEDVDPNDMLDALYAAFQRDLSNGIDHIVFDMGNVAFPSGSFIALLIAMTIEIRRKGGDLKIINLCETAQNHFSIFTPLTYLSIGLDSISALEDVTAVSPSLVEEFAEFSEGQPSTITVDAIVDSLNTVTHFVEVLGKKAELDPIDLSKLKIAVYEACMNVIEHGYGFDPGHHMEIKVLRNNDSFQVSVRDWGQAFDFYGIKPFDVEDAYSEKRDGGFGLYIIQKSVDEVIYDSDPDSGNVLTLVKYLNHR